MSRVNIHKRLNKLFKVHSIACEVFETKKNEFDEVDGVSLVTELNGIFYEETTRVNLNINSNGTSTTITYKTFMVLKDKESDKVKKSMFCTIKGNRYEIIEVSNEGLLDIYYTFRLKVCEE